MKTGLHFCSIIGKLRFDIYSYKCSQILLTQGKCVAPWYILQVKRLSAEQVVFELIWIALSNVVCMHTLVIFRIMYVSEVDTFVLTLLSALNCFLILMGSQKFPAITSALFSNFPVESVNCWTHQVVGYEPIGPELFEQLRENYLRFHERRNRDMAMAIWAKPLK